MNIDSGFLTSSLFTGDANNGFRLGQQIRANPLSVIPSSQNEGPQNAIPGVEVSVGGANTNSGFGGAIRNALNTATTLFSNAVSWLRKSWSKLTSVSSLLNGLAKSIQFVMQFDWNKPDSAIVQQQEALKNQIAGYWGEATGRIVGSFLCGGLVASALKNQAPKLFKVDTDLVVKMQRLKELLQPDSDLYEDGLSELKSALTGTARALKSYVGLEAFKNARSIIRAVNSGMNLNIPFIEKWGQEGSDPFSFASAIEEWVESFDGMTEAFLENAVEAFFDACPESIICVANAVR